MQCCMHVEHHRGTDLCADTIMSTFDVRLGTHRAGVAGGLYAEDGIEGVVSEGHFMEVALEDFGHL